MKFLKQNWSGRIYVKTDVLAQRKDMAPYRWPPPPVAEEKIDGSSLCANSIILEDAQKPFVPVGEVPGETQEEWCKRVFGLHISKVTKKDIKEWSGTEADLRLSKEKLLDQAMERGK